MTLYRPGTTIPFTDEDYIDLTLAKLSRLTKKGMHRDRFIFLVHEAKEILTELVRECKNVNNTPVEEADWPIVLPK
jgi:hypothetical protein